LKNCHLGAPLIELSAYFIDSENNERRYRRRKISATARNFPNEPRDVIVLADGDDPGKAAARECA
jgi:hypothetical protein